MGKTLAGLVKDEQKNYDNRIILAKVNGKLKEITDMSISDEKVEYITTDTGIGIDTYRRSVILLMQSAMAQIASSDIVSRLCVEFSISKGLFCDLKCDYEVTDEFLLKVKQKMHEMVDKDVEITKKTMKTSKAIKLFEGMGMNDKIQLFKYRTDSYVNVYTLEGYSDYFYGYMAASTGILRHFDLFKHDKGFVLQLPVKNAPDVVPPFEPQTKLFNTLMDTTRWAEMMELNTVGSINEHIVEGDLGDLMLVHEASQEQKMVEIVNMIRERKGVKFIMIAGPSSSGKTTFSHRLSIQLRANGFKPHPIGVDDYFVERENTPKDAEGNYNFEDINAIDIDLFNNHMNALLAGKEVELPTFNFKLGKKEYNGRKLKMGAEDILVIEGIHCLNDKLSYTLPVESKFKIYISALTQLNVDEHNRVATTDVRLMRRLVRDSRTRGASATKTLAMWDSVRKGEEANIFPFQEEADVMFNSAMAHELSVLKPYVEPLLYSVSEDTPEYLEARRLLKFLKYVLPCSIEYVPIDSILREFVGGGCFNV